MLPAPLVAVVVESCTSLQVSGQGGTGQRRERTVAELGVFEDLSWGEKVK